MAVTLPEWGCKRLWCQHYKCYVCCTKCAALRCKDRCANSPGACGQVVKVGSEVDKYYGHWEGL